MLKQQFDDLRLQTLFEYVSHNIDKIKSDFEKQLMSSVIFGSPRVKYLPFDYNWTIKKEFDIVTDALVKLSSIVVALRAENWQDTHSLLIKNYVHVVYANLRNGLLLYGCITPPYKLPMKITKEAILQTAQQVLELNIQTTEELNMFIESDI